MTPISAAILAGGRAARMGGADKAALVVGGRRIIDRQLALLAPISDDIRIVANDSSRYAGLGIRVVADAIAGAGPLGGVYTALIDARHELVLVLACDLPFVSAALLQRLIAESSAPDHGDRTDAVVPRSTRGREPLCAVYRARVARSARACIERGDMRMTTFLDDLQIHELDAAALSLDRGDALFENVNTPHDYARARARVEVDEKPFEDRITE